MQITITVDTAQPLNAKDTAILAAIRGDSVTGWDEAEVEVAKPAAEKPAKPAAKPKPKPKPEPEPEPEPEPMAEEPLPEEPEEEEEADGDDMSDEDLLALAVKKATEMVSSGNAATVREALDAAGANRVRELNKDNVREFFKALS